MTGDLTTYVDLEIFLRVEELGSLTDKFLGIHSRSVAVANAACDGTPTCARPSTSLESPPRSSVS